MEMAIRSHDQFCAYGETIEIQFRVFKKIIEVVLTAVLRVSMTRNFVQYFVDCIAYIT